MRICVEQVNPFEIHVKIFDGEQCIALQRIKLTPQLRFMVTEVIGERVASTRFLTPSAKIYLKLIKEVFRFAKRYGFTVQEVLEAFKRSRVPQIFLDDRLLSCLKVSLLARRALNEGSSKQDANESIWVFLKEVASTPFKEVIGDTEIEMKYSMESGEWMISKIRVGGREYTHEEYVALINRQLRALRGLNDLNAFGICEVCGAKLKIRNLRYHLARHLKVLKRLTRKADFNSLSITELKFATVIEELEERHGLTVEIDDLVVLGRDYVCAKIYLEGVGAALWCEGTVEECAEVIEDLMNRVKEDFIECPFCGRSYPRRSVMETAMDRCECGARVVKASLIHGPGRYWTDAIDMILKEAREALIMEEAVFDILFGNFFVDKILSNVKYVGMGVYGWPAYFIKGPFTLSRRGRVLADFVSKIIKNVKIDREVEERVRDSNYRCYELERIKIGRECIGKICPLFIDCLEEELLVTRDMIEDLQEEDREGARDFCEKAAEIIQNYRELYDEYKRRLGLEL